MFRSGKGFGKSHGKGGLVRNPKSEVRSPKEIRSPKSEWNGAAGRILTLPPCTADGLPLLPLRGMCLACLRRSMHGVPALAGCASGQAQYPNTSVALPAKAGTPCGDDRLPLNTYLREERAGERRAIEACDRPSPQPSPRSSVAGRGRTPGAVTGCSRAALAFGFRSSFGFRTSDFGF